MRLPWLQVGEEPLQSNDASATRPAAPRTARQLTRFLAYLVKSPAQEASAAASAQLALVHVWGLLRFATLMAYLPGLRLHRHLRRTGWVVPAVVVAQATEGAWAHRRLARGRAVHATLGVDLAVTAACVGAGMLDCRPEALDTDAVWTAQLGITTAAMGALFLPLPAALAVSVGLDALTAATRLRVVRRSGRGKPALDWLCFGHMAAARTLAALTRSIAAEVDDYHATAAELGARTGRVLEAQRVWQVAADRSLEVLARLQDPATTPTLSAIRTSAAEEALRLRAVLDGEEEPSEFTKALWTLAGDSAARGTSVELLTREMSLEPEGEVAAALSDALGAALGTLAAATRTTRAVVRLSSSGGTVVCTVRSRRPVRAAACEPVSGWDAARRRIQALGGSVEEPGTVPCEDPEWRFEVPA